MVGSVRAPSLASRMNRMTRVKPATVSISSKHAHRGELPPLEVLSVPAKPLSAPGDDLAGELRQRVGERNASSDGSAFSLAALARIGAPIGSALSEIRSGSRLVQYASKRSALGGEGIALLGDLLVFERVNPGKNSTVIGVAVSQSENQTIEFVYLARGIVRRGFVTPTQPRAKRDMHGRILNTFMRTSDGRDARGTRYLAGELFSNIIRLNKLLDP
jgi:hypothetical protein